MKWLSIALLTSAVVCLGAAGAAPAPGEDKLKESSYYPLAVGTTWHYKAGDNKFTMKVTKHEKVGDTLCARVEMTTPDKVAAENVAVRDDGVYRYAFEGKRGEPPVRFLKLPPKKGDAWTVECKVGTETLKGTVETGEEEVKVPAGTYKTVTSSSKDMSANGMPISFTYYFAENVGMVKQTIEVAGQKVVIELEKYESAKK